MNQRTPMAGGFFLILPVLVGFAWGLVSQQAMQGTLIGLLIGLVLLAIVWAVDRRRG